MMVFSDSRTTRVFGMSFVTIIVPDGESRVKSHPKERSHNSISGIGGIP